MILKSNDGLPEAARGERPADRRGVSRLWLAAALALLAAVMLMLRANWPSPQTQPAPKELVMGWRPILSQSGRGSVQTESFQIDTGQWRIKWSASAEEGADSAQRELVVGVHSAVSGRLMTVAVEEQGAGGGMAYVAEEPRPFFLSIESTGLQWTVHVEEGVLGERVNNAPHPISR